jgi:hypothetical protein
MNKFSVSVLSLVLLLLAVPSALAHSLTTASYTIRNMTFEGPEALPAGMTTITVINEESFDNMYALISLSEGRTLPEFFEAMAAVMQGLTHITPKWIHFHGGSPIGVDDIRSYTIFLGPGTYYLVSVGADADGPYAARGLVKVLTVTAPEPEANVRVTTQDYEFLVDGTFVSGRQTVRLENAANQIHEMLIISLPDDLTLEQYLAGPTESHEEHQPEAGPPFSMSQTQGLWVIDPGLTAFVEVELTPGRYALVCFVPDADGPHLMQGMAKEFSVQ